MRSENSRKLQSSIREAGDGERPAFTFWLCEAVGKDNVLRGQQVFCHQINVGPRMAVGTENGFVDDIRPKYFILQGQEGR